MTDGTLLQAAQPHQPDPAEQLHRHHGAGHAAGDRGGHIDLSVGSVSGFVGALAAVLMVNYNWNFVAASLLCLVWAA
jgi:putative multiple sugar transport system permease protein